VQTSASTTHAHMQALRCWGWQGWCCCIKDW